ncbi:hypothetical protein EDB85DRAFT_2053284 [Lactarius pseudohatsudake]|nr:hypothetical protein EDB85DRAFT_2053284 [Lactarius pseudohatsudake]
MTLVTGWSSGVLHACLTSVVSSIKKGGEGEEVAAGYELVHDTYVVRACRRLPPCFHHAQTSLIFCTTGGRDVFESHEGLEEITFNFHFGSLCTCNFASMSGGGYEVLTFTEHSV